MTREEVKDLLKFIIRKCDLVINNENYTDDEYVQGKIEDIAGMCHRALDGHIEPSLPFELDAAAEKYAEHYHDRMAVVKGFKAGAEWMAGQGASYNTKVGWIDGPTVLDWPDDILDKFEMGDEVIVQIRKKQ